MRIVDGEIVLTLGEAVAIGSEIAHAGEALSSEGHPLDTEVFKHDLSKPEIRGFMNYLSQQSLLPLRRDGVPYHEVYK
jgi:hypothetical protein